MAAKPPEKPGSGVYSPTKIAVRAEAEAAESRDELLVELRGQIAHLRSRNTWLTRALIGFLLGGGAGASVLRSNVGGVAEMLLSSEAVAEMAEHEAEEAADDR